MRSARAVIGNATTVKACMTVYKRICEQAGITATLGGFVKWAQLVTGQCK